MNHALRDRFGLFVNEPGLRAAIESVCAQFGRVTFLRIQPATRAPGSGLHCACFLRLADIIAALVVIRITLQFLFQTIGIIVLRIRRPDLPRPFRMWLYPVPALLAIAGFVFILVNRPDFQRQVRYAMVILILGIVIYLVRAARRHEWPFGRETRAIAGEAPGASG